MAVTQHGAHALLNSSTGREVKILTVIDEYTRECLELKGARSLRSGDVLEVPTAGSGDVVLAGDAGKNRSSPNDSGA
jgi:hypothetical protein